MVSTLMVVVEKVLDILIKTLVDKVISEGAHNMMQQVRIQQQRKLKNLPNNLSNVPLYNPPQMPKEHGNLGWLTIVRYEG